MNLIKYVNLDYILSILSFILMMIFIQSHQRNKRFLTLIIFLSLLSRIYQYAILIQSLKKDFTLNLPLLLTFYISHFTLFSSLNYYNYLVNGSKGFNYPGSPHPGSEIENNSQLKAKKEFEDNIGLNMFYFTCSTSFSTGYGDITSSSRLGKILNSIQMFDSAVLLSFLISYTFSSFRRVPKVEKYEE